MNRCALLVILLAFPLFAAAQTPVAAVAQTAGAQTTTAPQPLQTIIVPAPGAPSTNTGTAVIIASPSTPLLVTPEVHLATAVPQVGASNATPGNTAGATSSTSAIPQPPRALNTVPEYATAGAAVIQTPPPEALQGSTSVTTGAGPQVTGTTGGATTGTGAGTPIVIMNNTRLFDRGVGSGASLVAGGNSDGRTLGEIARGNRQREAGANARVYTNQDIDRINQQPGTQIGGISGTTVGAGTATGAQPQPPSGAMPIVSQPSPTPAMNPGVSHPVPPR
jgi:hypothetical protein